MAYGEGQTPLSQEELDDLKVVSITTRAELDELEQQNIEHAQEWLLGRRFSAQRILSEGFILELHKRMFSDVWRWAGEIRRSNKNLGVDWPEIRTHLRELLTSAGYWIDHRTYPEDEIAIRFSYRIVTIHCFANGNGRHSRLMADVIIDKIFGKPPFSWGSANLAQQ
jgi:Fic-DOC domain mobile mystery protein B